MILVRLVGLSRPYCEFPLGSPDIRDPQKVLANLRPPFLVGAAVREYNVAVKF